MRLPRVAEKIILTNTDINALKSIATSSMNPEYSRRARVILECGSGKSNKEVSAITGMNVNDVGRWRKTFVESGIDGLVGRKVAGARIQENSDKLDQRILGLLSENKEWTIDTLAKELDVSHFVLSEALRRLDINLQRQRQWFFSTDDELLAKHVDIVGLYLTKLEQAMIICCGKQPLPRMTGTFITRDRELSEDFKAYPNSFSLTQAINTAAHRVESTSRLMPVSLSVFLDKSMAHFPQSAEYEYHILICTPKPVMYRGLHLKNLYPAWTSDRAQWLDLICQQINELTDKAHFNTTEDLRKAIQRYIEDCRETTSPLMWRKTFQSQSTSEELMYAHAEPAARSGTESSPFLDGIRRLISENMTTAAEDQVVCGFIAFAYDKNEVRLSVNDDHQSLIKPSEYHLETIQQSETSFTAVEKTLVKLRNEAGVNAAEIVTEMLKKKPSGLEKLIEVDSELGRYHAALPVSTARHLYKDERVYCGGLTSRICEHVIHSSYRLAAEQINRDYHREAAGCALPLMTIADIANREGQRMQKAIKRHTIEILTQNGFNPDGLWPENTPFPEELRNRDIEYIVIDPDKVMHNAGFSPPEKIKFKEGEASKPETGLHLRQHKRRGSRVLIADEARCANLEGYVRYINTQEGREPFSMIRHPFKVEKHVNDIVNIFIDGDLVPEQSESRIRGGKPETRIEHTFIKHIDIRIETDEGGRYNITSPSIKEAYATLLAFLLETGLIQRFMHVFLDGEKKLKETFNRYFSHWHYRIFLDALHAEEKIDTLTSLGIKAKRVDSPWEEPEYYKTGPKKGEVRLQPKTSLSRTYASVIKTGIFYGNVEEVIEYICHIPDEDVSNRTALNQLITYFEERKDMLTCYALRKHVGLKNSSNSSELCNELMISGCQKVDDRMHWCEEGSAALATITSVHLNQGLDCWFSHRTVKFELYFEQPTRVFLPSATNSELVA